MKIYTDPGNTQALKVIILNERLKSKFNVVIVCRGDGFVSARLKNKLPTVERADGSFFLSVNEAAKFVAESGGQSFNDAMDKWLQWEENTLQLLVHQVVFARLNNQGDVDQKTYSQLIQELKALDAKLKSSQYIVESSLSVADVCVWSTLASALLDPTWLPVFQSDVPSVLKWFSRLRQDSSFQVAMQKFITGHTTQELIQASIQSQPTPSSSAVTPTVTVVITPAPEMSRTSSTSTATGDAEGPSRPPVTPDELAAAIEALTLDPEATPTPKPRLNPVLKVAADQCEGMVEEEAAISQPLPPPSTSIRHLKLLALKGLPIEGEKNVLITSALPYVNNVPHLGNIIGCVLSADVYARFCRLRNYNTLYICGTDEYGTATETKAMEEKLTPQQICDKYNKLHTEIYDWFNIDFDNFGRTTTDEQTKIAQSIFWKLQENGFILKDSVEQLRCEKCERYLADRFVEGTCPFCAYDDARGDQCDSCGKLINAVELINPRCKVCSNSPVKKSTSHLFMDLPKLEPLLQAHLDNEFERGIWTHNCKVITKSWIRDGLKPRCISRDLKWGTKVPLEGYTDKVFYVWYDAPIGYISITAKYTDQWERWWKNPKQVELYQFMAKDNVPFHSVIFPCELLGTKEEWTVVNHLSATEYLNYEDGKFSKSRGVGVFGNNAQDTGIPADIWRFYLLFIRPESQDSAFSWEDFMTKNNSELLNNLGNFINRALKFVSSNFGGRVPEMTFTDEDHELVALVTRELKAYIDNLEKIKLRDGIRNILMISKLGNQYMQSNKPWVLVKGSEEEKVRAGTVVGLAANMACLLSVMVHPYMPEVSKTIQSQLNAPHKCNVVVDRFICYLKAGHQIGTPSPLFQKIEASVVQELQKKFAGKQQDSPAEVVVASPEEIAQLTEEATKQGNVVRELKASGAPKEEVQKEVAKLQLIKAKLTKAQGGPAAGDKKKGGKPGKQGGGGGGGGGEKKPAAKAQQPPKPKPVPTASKEEIERLAAEVEKQATLVREVKAAKAEKAKIDQEIGKLLELKGTLAIAKGENPDAGAGGGKKKKGKK